MDGDDSSAVRESLRDDDRVTLASGMSFHLRSHGAAGGKPTVFLHGVLSAAISYDVLCRSLARSGRRIIAVDQRGHGESDHASDYAWECWVEDIAAILDVLDLRRVDLVGHSMGANHAAWFTALHPQRVRRLALLEAGFGPTNSPSEPQYWDRVAQLFPPDGFESPSSFVDRALELFPRAATSIVEESTRTFVRGDDGRWRWPMQADMRVVSGARTSPSAEHERRLRASVTCPTLVARAEFSELFTGSASVRVADEYQNGIHHLLKGTGHMIMWESVDETVAVLDAFLD